MYGKQKTKREQQLTKESFADFVTIGLYSIKKAFEFTKVINDGMLVDMLGNRKSSCFNLGGLKCI